MDNANIESIIPSYRTIDSDIEEFREYIDSELEDNQSTLLEDVIDWERLPRSPQLPGLVKILSREVAACRNEDEYYASSRGMYFAVTTLQMLYEDGMSIAFPAYAREGGVATASEMATRLHSDIGHYLSDSQNVANLIASYMPEISGYSRADHCAELGAGAIFLFGETYRREQCIKQTVQDASIDELMLY